MTTIKLLLATAATFAGSWWAITTPPNTSSAGVHIMAGTFVAIVGLAVIAGAFADALEADRS